MDRPHASPTAQTLPPRTSGPKGSLVLPATFLFLISAPVIYFLYDSLAQPQVAMVYIFGVWALFILLAFIKRRGPWPAPSKPQSAGHTAAHDEIGDLKHLEDSKA